MKCKNKCIANILITNNVYYFEYFELLLSQRFSSNKLPIPEHDSEEIISKRLYNTKIQFRAYTKYNIPNARNFFLL